MLIEMEKQLKLIKKDRKYLKSENGVLKENSENYHSIIQKLNTALVKATGRIKLLEERIGVHD